MSGTRSSRRVRTTPRALVVPAIAAVLFLCIPLVTLLIRSPWTSLVSRLWSPLAREALVLSLVCASLATLLCLLFGVPLAWLLANSDGWITRFVRALVIVPLVLPPVVGGVALLLAFGRSGLLGAPIYSATGLALPFSTAGVVVADTFVALPFMVLAVEGSLRSVDPGYGSAAAALGAGPWTVLRRITLPMIAPGVAAGAMLAWARALGEFGATITFAGSLPGSTQTMPLAVYASLETDQGDAVALSLVLIAVSIAVLVVGRGRWFGFFSPRGAVGQVAPPASVGARP